MTQHLVRVLGARKARVRSWVLRSGANPFHVSSHRSWALTTPLSSHSGERVEVGGGLRKELSRGRDVRGYCVRSEEVSGGAGGLGYDIEETWMTEPMSFFRFRGLGLRLGGVGVSIVGEGYT